MGGHTPDETGIIVIFYIFFILSADAFINYLLSLLAENNVFKQIPYVVYVFVLGFIIGISSDSLNSDTKPNIINDATIIFDNFPPELLIYLFLPILIYGEVVNLNVHHFESTLPQGLILAGPCAIFGTLIMAAMLNNGFFPYPVDWSENSTYLFCSTLAATGMIIIYII